MSASATCRGKGQLGWARHGLSNMGFREDCLSLQAQSSVTMLKFLKSHQELIK